MLHGVAKLGPLAGAALLANSASFSNDMKGWLEVAVILAGIGAYIVLQARDYKPNRRLRAELSELRATNDDLSQRLDAADKDRHELRENLAKLERSRDFDAALASVVQQVSEHRAQAAEEHRGLLDEFREHGRLELVEWKEIHKQNAAIATSLQVIAAGLAAQ